jgi:hypothetical protein
MDLSSAQGAVGGPSYAGMDLSSAQGAVGGPSYAGMDLSSAQGAVGGPSYAGMDLSSAQGSLDAVPERGFVSRVTNTATDLYDKYLSPNRNMPTMSEIGEQARKIQAANPGISAEFAYKEAQKQLTPGVFARYAPLVATGTGIAALSGAFSPEPEKPLNIAPKKTGFDLLREDPSKYGVTPGGANIIYGPYLTTPPRFAQGGIAAMAPRRFNLGGYAAGGIGNARFPRKTGPINGPGTGTSDSIPAMLSDGEFVFTAKAVRGAGKGSRREGAKRMYAMMKALERKA